VNNLSFLKLSKTINILVGTIMKTYTNLYKNIFTLENLKLAFEKAKKGKAKKYYVIKFEENLDEELKQL